MVAKERALDWVRFYLAICKMELASKKVNRLHELEIKAQDCRSVQLQQLVYSTQSDPTDLVTLTPSAIPFKAAKTITTAELQPSTFMYLSILLSTISGEWGRNLFQCFFRDLLLKRLHWPKEI